MIKFVFVVSFAPHLSFTVKDGNPSDVSPLRSQELSSDPKSEESLKTPGSS
jgi:hypothetical protein